MQEIISALVLLHMLVHLRKIMTKPKWVIVRFSIQILFLCVNIATLYPFILFLAFFCCY